MLTRVYKPKSSSAIKEIQYDIETNTLAIQFTSSNKFYNFYEVPHKVVMEFAKASSCGQFYNKNIRNKYYGG